MSGKTIIDVSHELELKEPTCQYGNLTFRTSLRIQLPTDAEEKDLRLEIQAAQRRCRRRLLAEFAEFKEDIDQAEKETWLPPWKVD